MDGKEYIKHIYDYSYWANRRYLAVAEGLTEEQLHRKQGHSWGDVHSVFVHMMSSETVWLKRWQGTSPRAHLDPADFPTLIILRERWAEVEQQVRAFIENQSEAGLENQIEYINFSGESFRLPQWQMLMHVPNHETHHRGELAAMFALMNVPHPEEEVIQYFLARSGQKKLDVSAEALVPAEHAISACARDGSSPDGVREGALNHVPLLSQISLQT